MKSYNKLNKDLSCVQSNKRLNITMYKMNCKGSIKMCDPIVLNKYISNASNSKIHSIGIPHVKI